jgi:hypothetical protein
VRPGVPQLGTSPVDPQSTLKDLANAMGIASASDLGQAA